MSPRARFVFALVCAGLSGCATLHETVQTKAKAYMANTPDLQPADLQDFRDRQAAIVALLEESAGTPGLKNGDDWRPVVDEGIHYVDVRCSRFMDALFWLNRARDTSSNEIRYAGAGTSALLALVAASKELIGITPLAFGFLDQTLNNVGQGLLYNLEPGIVRGLVAREQTTFKTAITNTRYTTRGAALEAIQQYAELCLPVSIEGEVNRAISNSEFQAVNYRVPIPVPPTPPATGAAGGGRVPPSPAATPSNVNVVPVVEQRPH
jgi:hypothetical protein